MRPKLPLFAFFLCALCSAPAARAQVIEGVHPARVGFELAAGYGFMGSQLAASGARLNLNGVGGAAVFVVNDDLDVVADVGVFHAGNVAQSGLDLTVSSYQFGPRLLAPSHKRLSPFIQVLFGGGHAGGTLYTRPLGPGLAPLGANNSLTVSAGGGADWKLRPNVAIRIIQAEYLHSQFLNGEGNGNRQDSIRLSTGFAFTFGN